MIRKIDMHMHSTSSDGQYTPAELVYKAKENDIELMALTDHDTVDGLKEAVECVRDTRITFVPGIEISTQDSEEIHILGYGVDKNNHDLRSFCDEFKEARLKRGQVICDYLSGLGIYIDYDDIKKKALNGLIARPLFAEWMQDHGIVSTRKEAFKLYLDTPEFREATERKKPDGMTSVSLIHKAGGKAVLAHPGLYRMDTDEKESLVKRLKDCGLDGIECLYSKHTKEERDIYLEWARKYDLKISCGSDFHGEKVKPDVKMGMEFDQTLYGEQLILL